MKKLYLLLSIFFLIYGGCEEEQDTTPPTVIITSPRIKRVFFVSELVIITCRSSDDKGIAKVELYVNDVSTGYYDDSEPYSFEWNTTSLDDGNYTIKVRSYDTSGNTTDSQPINLIITPLNIITWPHNNSVVSELVLITCMLYDKDGIEKVELFVNDVSIDYFDDSEPYSFEWNTTSLDDGIYTIIVRSYDTNGNTTDSQPINLIINNSNSEPTPSELNQILYYNGFQLIWSQNIDSDFSSYELYESLNGDMTDQTLVYQTMDIVDTNYVIMNVNVNRYYQVTTYDIWSYKSTSNIELLLTHVELWGESYSIEETTDLNLYSQGLTGSIPSEIGYLTNLSYLNLSGNQLAGEIPSELENLANLSYLNLSGNQLAGEIPSELRNLTNLTELNFHSNQLSGSIPLEIGNLTNLNRLYLSENQLTGETPSEIWNLTDLNYLFLSYNELTGEIPPEIGNLSDLDLLNLSNNELSGKIPESICDLDLNWSDSTSFNISKNQLCPPYPSCINSVVGEQDYSIELWGETYSITTNELNLSNNSLSGSIPSEIGYLTNLKSLDLYNNQLTYSIPIELENLINLTYLNLGSNQLTGSIPSELGSLTNLTSLYLYNNQLTGSIPSELGSLANLTSFYLSDNQLTGEIPESFCNLVENNCSISIADNKLCPPYLVCIEDYIGEQDTTNCN